jgi:MoxR-like ATPase
MTFGYKNKILNSMSRKFMEQLENSISETDKLYTLFNHLQLHLQKRIIGQEKLIDRLLIALLCDGHLLVEGAPGLAKTKAIRELASCIEGHFHRIQFTPDLLPADITGTEIYRYQEGTFSFQPGPIFHHLILADEINRAPAKVQSALLEAMAERQITIGNTTYPLPKLFLVMATQNPIEQEGTYSLPEAQLDRFLLYLKIDYPAIEAERAILKLAREEVDLLNYTTENLKPAPAHIIKESQIFAARKATALVYLSPLLEEYLVQLIMATRQAGHYSEKISRWIAFGASPRATIGLDRAVRAHAWLNGRDYVSPADIHALAHDVLRHRIILTLEAQAENISTDEVIDEIIALVPVP